MANRPDHALLYDSDCGFCTRTLDRILRWDRHDRLRGVAIQSEEGARLLGPIPPARRLDSFHLVDPDGTIHSAGGAGPPLLRLLPGGRPLAALLAALPRATQRSYEWIAEHRDVLGRFLVVLMAVVLVGCGSSVQEDSELTVHAGLAYGGPDAAAGRAALAGAELALGEAGGEAGGVAVGLRATERVGGSGWTQARVAANARDATEDATSIAYIGELDPAATRISAAITNEAGIPQISPGPVPEALLREPGGNDPPRAVQTSGERTLIALRAAGSESRVVDPAALDGLRLRTAREEAAAAYGFEAMALILDAIERAEDPLDRRSVTAALLETSGRSSILGPYSIDPAGLARFE